MSQDKTDAMEEVRSVVDLIRASIEVFMELEGQDHGLALEMASTMLGDYTSNGTLRPMIEYVKHYCDVFDNEDHAEEIVSRIAETAITL